MDGSHDSRFRIRIARGPRRAEELLVEEVLARTEELGLEALERPLVIVVPSRSLRLHILRRLTAAAGALAGVECKTLLGLALGIVRSTDSPADSTADLLPLFARRFARMEPSLVRSLEHLRDGFSAILDTVRDLLDAGIDPALVDALEEALATEGGDVASDDEVTRARCLIRVASRTLAELHTRGLYRPSSLQHFAAEALVTDELRVPGHFLVHGFSNATGTATDLLLAALTRWGGTLILDRPPDPARPEVEDAGAAFGRRFTERLFAAGQAAEEPAAAAPAASVRLVRAMGAAAEVRETVTRIQGFLDRGVAPEEIAVVARDFRHYRSPIRIHFRRLGIPFSGVGVVGPAGPVTTRVQALLDLLAAERTAPVERWLDARGRGFPGAASFDLRLALFSLGAGRVHEVAQLDLDAVLDGDTFPLPVRHGFFQVEEDDDGPDEDHLRHEVHLRRRRIPAGALEEAVAAARKLCERFDAPKKARTLGERLAGVRSLLADELGWQPDDSARREVLARLAQELRGVPGDLELDREEFTTLLRESLDGAGRVPLGGDGGGVQVLGVTEARGRTFEALFVLGLNRSVFPRTVREDPVLPDSLRAVLAREGHSVLPDLPLKRADFDEERYLFAQLLTAAPHITLSWQDADEDNAVLTPSPLVERLRWTDGEDGGRLTALPQTAPHVYAADGRARPAFEHSVIAAMRGRRDRLRQLLPLALSEDREPRPEGVAPSSDAAEARLRVLDELDPDRATGAGQSTASRLGPYFGWVGEPRGELDPRQADSLYVTTLERLCGCPWQVFLERILRIQPLPDPLEVLPSIDPLVVGDLVHTVAERIVLEAHPGAAGALEEARAEEPHPVAWPDGDALEAVLGEEARRVARRHGIGMPGFDRILARRTLPYLEEIRKVDWAKGPIANLSAEARGAFQIEAGGVERSISFKVDRLDVAGGGLVFSDYKSGRRPVSSAKQAKTRHAHLLRDVRSGLRLQAVAYVLAGGGEADQGRYLFVAPGLEGPPESRQASVTGRDSDLLEAFDHAARTALAGWNQGTFFPRVVSPDRDEEPVRCRFCTVAEACLRGDSGARRRIREWVDHRSEGLAASDAEAAILDLWQLPSGGSR